MHASPRCRPVIRAVLIVVLLFSITAPESSSARALNTQDLNRKVSELVKNVRLQQNADGSWSYGRGGQWKMGATSLAVLALRSAGVSAEDDSIARGTNYIVNHKSTFVYETALRAMAIREVAPLRYKRQLRECTDLLVRAQQPDGGWSYRNFRQRSDFSNSQFALLGLRAAAESGIVIPRSLWANAERFYLNGQLHDGSWGYTRPSNKAAGSGYGSMTAAGIASLHIITVQQHLLRGVCGEYRNERNMQAAINWLGKNFSVKRNPRKNVWHFYYLYALERAGVIAARKRFGAHDWYREGVAFLLSRQAAAKRRAFSEPLLLRQCYSLLFLAKGRAPVLIQKAAWAGTWKKYSYDTEFLTRYVSNAFEQNFSWQAVRISSPLEELMEAPILYVCGYGDLAWSAEHLDILKKYIEQGGFIFAVNVKGSASFAADFAAVIKKLFPEQQIEQLAKNHPVYTSFFKLPRDRRLPLYGFNTGHCKRSPIIYSTNDIACEWDIADYAHFHFRLGTNVIAYATGLEKIREKLDPISIKKAPTLQITKAKGAFRVGEIVHSGFWHPHQKAWPRLLSRLNLDANVDVVTRPVPVRLDSDDPFKVNMLFLTGYRGIKLSNKSIQRLRQYLERGGFLFAEAFCGSKEFDKAFREMVVQLFPEAPLKRAPQNHSLFTLGKRLGKIRYRELVRKEMPGLDQPYLEYVEHKGRVVIAYSKFDLFTAIDGTPCFNVFGVLDPDATELAMKVIAFSLAY